MSIFAEEGGNCPAMLNQCVALLSAIVGLLLAVLALWRTHINRTDFIKQTRPRRRAVRRGRGKK